MYIFTYVERLLSDRASHTQLLNDRVEAITHCVRLQSANGFLWGQEGVGKRRCTLNKPAESKRVSHPCQIRKIGSYHGRDPGGV